MANHLEQLIAEWLEFQGYFVQRNIRVGKLAKGGYEGELDVVGYHPGKKHLMHIEASVDAHNWAEREKRFKKKFDAGKKYIHSQLFPWLSEDTQLEQWAVLWASDMNHKQVGGGRVVPLWELYQIISKDVCKAGSPVGHAISEQFSLLRTMQYTLYWGVANSTKT